MCAMKKAKKEIEAINSPMVGAANAILKHKNKFNSLLGTSISCLVAIVAGASVGTYFGIVMSKPGINYDAFDPLSYEDDVSILMDKYNKNNSINQFQPYDLVNIAAYKYANEEHTSSITHGQVKAAGVKQLIYAYDVHIGNDIFNESISYSSLVKCASRFYEGPEKIKEYLGSSVKESGTAKWKFDQEVTLEEHENLWGKHLTRPLIYIVSSKTVLDSNLEEQNDNYIVTLNLDPITSVLRYVKQMVKVSNLKKSPQFSSIQLTFTLDKELNLKQLDVSEKYTVYVVGENKSNATLTQVFNHQSSEPIPDTETDIVY